MIRRMDEGIVDLGGRIRELMEDGYGVVCMYATEKGDMPRSIQTVLRKGERIVHITTVLESDSYQAMSPFIPQLRPYERDMREMNGLDPIGLKRHYGPQRLQWGYTEAHPLQKEELPAERHNVPLTGNRMSGDGVFEIPVGPVHAGIIEPGHFRFSVAGEPILKMRTSMGYTYRGIERMAERPAAVDQTRLMERACGDTAVANALAYAHAMEGDTEIPRRARLLRTVFAELERMYCHFGDIGGIAMDAGLSVPAARGAELKEEVHRMNAEVCGHRFLMGTIIPGGVRRNIPDSRLDLLKKRMLRIGFELEELVGALDDSSLFLDRAETTGILTHENALRYRALGPTARASGVKTDVRKELPYDAYSEVGMRLITHDKGDVYSRMFVKAKEIVESVNLINQCLDLMDGCVIRADVSIVDGFRLGIVEAPRGELVHAVNIVNGGIWRYRIRDPSFINWIALETALPGNIVPDFPLINKSFNLSYSGYDL